MARVSKTSPFQSQRLAQQQALQQAQQQAANTEGEKKEEEEEEEKKEESKGDDEEKTTSSSSSSSSDDEKKKGKRPMKPKKKKQKTRSINEIMYGPGGKPKGIVIGGARAEDGVQPKPKGPKPPAAKRRKLTVDTKVKSSYSLRSRKMGSGEEDPKGEGKEEETDDVWEANLVSDSDEKGKNVAEESDYEESSDDESD